MPETKITDAELKEAAYNALDKAGDSIESLQDTVKDGEELDRLQESMRAIGKFFDLYRRANAKWSKGQTSESKTDALNALKIDMVSVEKRLSQLGASELLQGLADLVSGAIEDLQVEAEREEGDNPSPPSETINHRREVMFFMEGYLESWKETIIEQVEDIEEKAGTPDFDFCLIGDTLDLVWTDVYFIAKKQFPSLERQESNEILRDCMKHVDVPYVKYLTRKDGTIESEGDKNSSPQSSDEAIETEGLDKKFRVWTEMISDKSTKEGAIAEFEESERHTDLEIHVEEVSNK